MPKINDIYKSKVKIVYESLENYINNDVLQGMFDDSPLSTQKQEQELEKIKEIVPGGEIVQTSGLSDDVKSIFRKIIIYASDSENHPEDFDPVGYVFSVIYKKGKAIDFSGGFIMNTNDVSGEEFYMSLTDKDSYGSNLFYKINMMAKSVATDYSNKNI